MDFVKDKKIILLILLLSAFCLLNAQKKNVRINPIPYFINSPGLKYASVGICVKNDLNETLISYNHNKAHTPASILKAVTTATALELLGAEYKYETTLATDKNNKNSLLIHGYGDPTLGTAFLNNVPTNFITDWLQQILSKIDRSTPVNITVIDDYFGYDGISDRWIYQDLGNYYASGAYGISIFDNTYKLYLNTMQEGCPQIVRTEPKMNLNFKNTLGLNNTGEDNAYIHGLPFSYDRVLTGDVPAGKKEFQIKGDISNPGLFLGETLAQQINNERFNIGVVKTTYDKYYEQMYEKTRSSFDENIFYTHYSLPLKDILTDINVRSNNHYAEHLIRTIGRINNKDVYSSALNLGISETIKLWKGRGLDTDGLFMYDGSGLSPANGVSPEFMCDLLLYMLKNSENSETYLSTFPRAGMDGTLRSLLKGTRLEGKIHAKSGSFSGVQCFAGYYINGSDKQVFTVMVNKYTGSRSQVLKAIETLLLATF